MKKTYAKRFLQLFCCFWNALLIADECELSRFYLGPQAYYVDFSIANSDSNLAGLLGLNQFDSSLRGALWGANGGYEFEKGWGVYANVDLNYGQGKLKKSGQLTRYAHEYEGSAVVGYEMGGTPCACWAFIGYVGLDYLTQYFSVSELGVKYRYYLTRIPVGVRLEYLFDACCGHWSLGLNGTVLPQVDSTVKINLLQGARWTLAKRTDWFVSVPLQYVYESFPLGVCVDLFWRRVGIGGSKAVSRSGNSLGLPPSRWNAWGVNFDIVFEF